MRPRSTDLILLTLAFAAVGLPACQRAERRSDAFDVTARFPHDPTAYTQGLLWADGALYESTGRYGHSELRRVDLESGRVLASRKLPDNRFGEGWGSRPTGRR